MTVDIFDEKNSMRDTWFAPKQIGDAVQGTYVGKREGVNKYNHEQFIYELKNESGIVNVAVRKTHKAFVERMDQIRLGQIVGVKFTELLPSKEGGRNPTKVLRIYANPHIVDQAWIDEQKQLKSLEISDGSEGADDEDVVVEGDLAATLGLNQANPPAKELTVDEPFPDRVLTDEEKLKVLVELAKAKLGAVDPLTMKDKVMEATGLAFINSNLDQIIAKLRSI